MLGRNNQEVFHKNPKENLLKTREKEVLQINQIRNLEVNQDKEKNKAKVNKR